MLTPNIKLETIDLPRILQDLKMHLMTCQTIIFGVQFTVVSRWHKFVPSKINNRTKLVPFESWKQNLRTLEK